MVNKMKISFLSLGLIFASQSASALNFNYSVDLNQNAKKIEGKIQSLKSSAFRKDMKKDALDIERLSSVAQTYNNLNNEEKKEFSKYCNSVISALKKHAKRTSGKRVFHKSSQYYKQHVGSVLGAKKSVQSALMSMNNENKEQDFLLSFANIVHQDMVDAFWNVADSINNKLSVKLSSSILPLSMGGHYIPHPNSKQNAPVAQQTHIHGAPSVGYFTSSEGIPVGIFANKSSTTDFSYDIKGVEIFIDSANTKDGITPASVSFGNTLEGNVTSATAIPVVLYGEKIKKSRKIAGFIVASCVDDCGTTGDGINRVALTCEETDAFHRRMTNIYGASYAKDIKSKLKCVKTTSSAIVGYGGSLLNIESIPSYYSVYDDDCCERSKKELGSGYNLNLLQGFSQISDCDPTCTGLFVSNKCLKNCDDNRFINIFNIDKWSKVREKDCDKHYPRYIFNTFQGEGPKFDCSRVFCDIDNTYFSNYSFYKKGCDLIMEKGTKRGWVPITLEEVTGDTGPLMESGSYTLAPSSVVDFHDNNPGKYATVTLDNNSTAIALSTTTDFNNTQATIVGFSNGSYGLNNQSGSNMEIGSNSLHWTLPAGKTNIRLP